MAWTWALLADATPPHVSNDGFGGLAPLALFCVFGVFGLLATAFWVWMLVDALTNEPTTNDKILWLLVLVFLQVLGALLYYFIRRRARRPAKGDA